ncbi:MAG: MmcB family DNA repair protein [Variibacter sp.]|nr:MmcB family DNA repair protein [Variibacter sp.]
MSLNHLSVESLHAEVVVVDGRQSPTAALVARGAARLLRALGFSCIPEMPLTSGRRADLVALGPDGEIWIVEIKSSIEDFRVDQKWPDYRWHCDRLFFATAAHVPLEIFPADAGLILADSYGAEVMRDAPEHRLSGATRRSMMLRYARLAALRLQAACDPAAAALGAEF